MRGQGQQIQKVQREVVNANSIRIFFCCLLDSRGHHHVFHPVFPDSAQVNRVSLLQGSRLTDIRSSESEGDDGNIHLPHDNGYEQAPNPGRSWSSRINVTGDEEEDSLLLPSHRS